MTDERVNYIQERDYELFLFSNTLETLERKAPGPSVVIDG